MKQNKFKIIIPSFNNEDWVEYNIASILNQTYINYDVLYIDDASTDSTYNKVKNLVADFNNWTIIKNSENQGATANYFDNLDEYIKDENEIVIHLDGDDWLYDENVLEKLNDFYNQKDCWMTYGGFLCFNGTAEAVIPYPQSTEYSDFVHKHKLYRRDEWRASHMRTYRAFLLKSINKKDITSLIDGKYYWHATDLAFQFSYMEMCPKEKICVIDFYAYVYNQSKSNSIRTQEREDSSNVKYELEIRNRKRYKEGLFGEKLHQINVWDKDYYLEYSTIPNKFTYCYQQVDGEFDMVLLCDLAALKYLDGKIDIKINVPIVVRLFEQRDYFNKQIYNAIIKNHNKFDAILTFDKELLKLIPNAIFLPVTEVSQFNRLPNPFGHEPYKSNLADTYELSMDLFKVYPKSKIVSAVVSNKAFLPGHIKRLEFIKSVKNKIDLFGRGMDKEIPSKLDALKDYMFSIAIENISCDDNYFSEKIIECFLTGTIPIYHGCINIGEFFDKRGILYFDTQDELNNIIDNLSEEKYYSMLEYANKNYEACYKWPLNNDMLYDMYYKQIIEKGVIRK
jgi:glycosyltransferase involved in cell wall biosynthesis